MAKTRIRISGTRNIGALLLLLTMAIAAGFAGCSDGPTGLDATSLLPGLTVSDIQDGPASAGALAAGSPGVTYVSASPGTFEDAKWVIVTNLANGESETVRSKEDGFDPVALEANAGDEIEIAIHHYDGSTTSYRARVPVRKRPRIVRTVPPRGATDVVLSTSIIVVFSEPVDGSTITAETFQLRRGGDPVDGTIALDDVGIEVTLDPSELLIEGATYQVLVSGDVLDLTGEPLEEALDMSFTTGSSVAIELCAKASVVNEINSIVQPLPWVSTWSGPEIHSTSPACTDAIRDWSPRGTFTYNQVGGRMDYTFEAEGLVPIMPIVWTDPRTRETDTYYIGHKYVLILYPEPWPGRNLDCLGSGFPADTHPDHGTLRFSGSRDFHGDLNGAKIWVVRDDWVDCTGHDYRAPLWPNPEEIPRLTNDRWTDGVGDATETGIFCWPVCGVEPGHDYELAYDFMFETELIYFHDTDG